MKNIVILGSTGSIGTNTLDIVDRFPQDFRVVGLTAGTNDEKLLAQIRRYKPAYVALANESAAARLRLQCADLPVEILSGNEGVAQVAQASQAELVVSAIVGGAGLIPTLAAIRAGKHIALANKEPMVMAGALMQAEAHKHHVRIFPVDSEHSAIFSVTRRTSARRRQTGDFNRFGRTAVEFHSRATTGCQPRARPPTSQLENGVEDYDRFCHADEQRP